MIYRVCRVRTVVSLEFYDVECDDPQDSQGGTTTPPPPGIPGTGRIVCISEQVSGPGGGRVQEREKADADWEEQAIRDFKVRHRFKGRY